ncbi:P-loop ATPase, Sll1717 family [Mesorhizobium koreense]|uniref:P-loop ATPase, Sll1717 family n=1 Tax=Mesorhizobium koreense TaxID=3074855 RepID=UPI00287B700A|nr:hypothetical protein [Mesorhizobium sp. WR6]
MTGIQRDRLPLRKLRFGNVDARYEVNTRDPRDVEHFKTSFLEPAGITIGDFINGKRFFVYGVKGAGKTALLRFIQLSALDQGSITKFISFATEISDLERERIKKLSGIDVYEQDMVEVKNNSAVDVWIIFILRQIARIIEENRSIFTSHRDTTIFCQLMMKFYDGEENKGLLKWLTDALKAGKYKIKTKYLDASIKGTDSETEREVPINFVIDQAFRLLKNLGWEGPRGIYLFFDELNLSFSSKATHKRDVILIRDLLIAIDRLNTFFIEKGKPIFLLAAARSEVLHALNAPTHEINKILADRGHELRWFARTSGGEWPIINLVQKKVRASERIYGIKQTDDVIGKYFYRDLYDFDPKSFIVEMTWCNPRDLVLLLGDAAIQAQPNEAVFGVAVIERILEKYSAAAWLEKAEELSVEYAPQEVQAIKKGLLGFYRHFKLNTFEQGWRNKADNDQTMKMMQTKYGVPKILEDLFRIGVLGQSTREPDDAARSFNQHWVYRGDNTFDSSAWLIVHKALWPELRLGKIRGSGRAA